MLHTAAILLTRGAEKGGGGVGRVLYTDVIVYEYAESTNTVDLSDARHQKLFKTSFSNLANVRQSRQIYNSRLLGKLQVTECQQQSVYHITSSPVVSVLWIPASGDLVTEEVTTSVVQTKYGRIQGFHAKVFFPNNFFLYFEIYHFNLSL